ncbi:hypothetical protein ASC77_24650 [Nocardioides sp. Root1257]|nr:hypothetical protein ASC77_24650 [Nocardioides sp. Root1257]KRC54626.1 hypothetical protein ASE24_24440 [Nocardioides sp. Root224]
MTHVAVAVGSFAWFVWSQVREYGLTSEDPLPMLLMDPMILVFAWLLTVPAAIVEASVRTRGRRWIARGAAGVANLVLVWFGCLPVGLRFFADRDPVTHAKVVSALANSLVLVGGYAALVVVLRVSFNRRTGGSAGDVA